MPWTNPLPVTSITVPTGATTGQRIVIINSATGDAIDVYDVNGNLVASIGADGTIRSLNPVTGTSITMTNATVEFIDRAGDQAVVTLLSSQPGEGTNLDFNLSNGSGHGAGSFAIFAGSSDLTQVPFATLTNGGVGGRVITTDKNVDIAAGGSSAIFHFQYMTGTTVDLGGGLIGVKLNHGCVRTPLGCAVSSFDGPSVTTQMAFQVNSFTSTQVWLEVVGMNGVTPGTGVAIEAFGFFALPDT